MKKLLFTALMGMGLFLALSSCEKEDLSPEYPFTIVVKTFDDSVRVSNAMVEILAPVQGSKVYFRGYTNENGGVSFKYNQEAIFLVRAIRGPMNDPTYIACAEVRLAPNETVVKTVYLQKVDPEIPGC
jgi:hypothetical protein